MKLKHDSMGGTSSSACTSLDAFVASDEAEDIIRNQIGKCFVVNKDSIGLPNRCLGGRERKVLLDNMEEA